ncbi:MAG TPA: hypothetical protein ENH13_03890 [Euryarchaeota archaeon]|nr:hypothetical protein BMS3Bbin16_00260 [archaeon BMS3Bbin16]HDH28254.1 hypothetical protein [Euryarchaeota archaeon]
MYYIKGLEYLGRNVTIRGEQKPVEAKRFVTLGKSDSMPSRDDVINAAKARSGVRKAWVMKMEGNKWSKAMETIDI